MTDDAQESPRIPPALQVLGLTAGELAALAVQGFVQHESRRGGRTVFKLRYRHGGRQRVRCLGSSPALADAVRDALTEYQRPHRARLMLTRQSRAARCSLRACRVRLAPLLAERGLRFHGIRIRARRNVRSSPGVSTSSIPAAEGDFPAPNQSSCHLFSHFSHFTTHTFSHGSTLKADSLMPSDLPNDSPMHDVPLFEDIGGRAPAGQDRPMFRLGDPGSLGAADPIPLTDERIDDEPPDDQFPDDQFPDDQFPDNQSPVEHRPEPGEFGLDANCDHEHGETAMGDCLLSGATGIANPASPQRELYVRVQAEAFSRSDPFEGLLLSACAQTAELAGLVQELTVRALEESTGRIEDLDAVLPAIRTVSKIYSQLQQFTLQQQRLSAARHAADPLMHHSASREDRWSAGPAWHPGAPHPAADPGSSAPR